MDKKQWEETIKYILKSKASKWSPLGQGLQHCEYNIGIPDLVMVVTRDDDRPTRFVLKYDNIRLSVPKQYDLEEWFEKTRASALKARDKKNMAYNGNVHSTMVASIKREYTKERGWT